MDPKSELYTSAATVRSRPGFAVQPGPGQESVWDYPRPPAILRDGRLVEVRDGHAVVATSKGAYKVMETASPPTFYIPAADIDFDLVVPVADTTYCEWKGTATYWALARNPAVARWLVLRTPTAPLRYYQGISRVLPGARRLLPWRGTSDNAGWTILWRLDHVGSGRAV